MAFGLLMVFMIGTARVQSYLNGFTLKTTDEIALREFHLDRTYLRKFTTRLSKFWLDGKIKPGKGNDVLLAAEFNSDED